MRKARHEHYVGQMSDAWLDLWRLCVMGAVGLGAAWLGAQATRRRERWGHRRKGLGIGLSISRSIIRSHGGRLWGTANASHGATFQLTLPGWKDRP